MDGLPPELVAHIYQHSTPNRRRTMLAANKGLAHAIRGVVTSCTLEVPDEVPMRIPDFPSPLAFPRLLEVRVQCSWLQVTLFLGSCDFAVFSGEPFATLASAGAPAHLLAETCLISGATAAAFHVRNEDEAAMTASVVPRCRGLQTVRITARRHPCLCLKNLASTCLRTATVQGVNCGQMDLPAARNLTLYEYRSQVHHMQSDTLQRLALRASAVRGFATRWDALTRLEVEVMVRSEVWLEAMPRLRTLRLTRVDVGFGSLHLSLPALERMYLVHSHLVGHRPRQFAEQASRHARLTDFELLVRPRNAAEVSAWQGVLSMGLGRTVTGVVTARRALVRIR